MTEMQKAIAAACDALKEFLLAKNSAYGNSVAEPVRVFSKVSPLEQLQVRIDDKLSRLAKGHALPDESLDDTVLDLIGYLVLWRILRQTTATRVCEACGGAGYFPDTGLVPNETCCRVCEGRGVLPVEEER